MRLRIFLILLAILLLAAPAAVAELQLSMERVPAQSILDFTLTGADAIAYRYTLLHEGEELFSTESEYAFGSFAPREIGSYTLKATLLGDGIELETSADFTVVDRLTLSCDPLPESVSVGGAVQACLQASGGTEPYRFVYAVTAEGQTLLEQTGGDHWYWAPTQEGRYMLHMAVIDAQGAVASLRRPLLVEASEGIGLVRNGGALCAHGGQESWMVCSTEPWTAETTADFLRIETPTGQPGDSLVVTALGQTDTYRRGTIHIVSGGQQLEWPVTQSALHGVDEEVFLFANEQPLYVDQQIHAVWTEASGSRSFTITPADAAWEVSVDSDFITATKDGDALTVTVAASDSAAVRNGLVTLSTSGSCAYLHIYQPPGRSASEAAASSSGLVWDSMTTYSQFSGLWKDVGYGSSTLEHSGCAIFALSHALQWLGYEGEEIEPAMLAEKYAFCLRDGGTINSTLVGNAGDDLGFKTRFDLYQEQSAIRSRLEQGAVFSFAVVNGHIAMVVEMSADGSMMRIIDSAPSATWERINGAQLYRKLEDGSFSPIASLAELEGIRYYPENNAFGGTTYWLESSYVAKRGVRLIQLREEE